MRACAFSLHQHSNLSREGDAQIRHSRSRSQHGHDLRHALHSRIDF